MYGVPCAIRTHAIEGCITAQGVCIHTFLGGKR